MQNQKIAIALSGGLDSSVSAFLLQQQGFEVVAITCKMVDDKSFEVVIENAKAVAKALNIEHYILDLTKEFEKNVIDYFKNSYEKGETPNPCIVCNKTIKWGSLLDFAMNKLGCDKIATGHYADIIEEGGVFKLFPARDDKKDQLYYLFELTQNQLSKTIFPLSNFTKTEVREIALKNNLPSKSAKESQDICFIKKPLTTNSYLKSFIKKSTGQFVHIKTNATLGIHDGFFQYTIGQRKGLGVAYECPLYVIKIDPEKNIVFLGEKELLLQDNLVVRNCNFLYPIDGDRFEANVKIRYNTTAKQAFLRRIEGGYAIAFSEKVSAIAKGQACVFYDLNDGHLIGGGWIC